MVEIRVFNATKIDSSGDGIIGRAIIEILKVSSDKYTIIECDSYFEADIVIGFVFGKECIGFDAVKRIYCEDKLFLVGDFNGEIPKDLPDNIKWLHYERLNEEALEYFNDFIPSELKRCVEMSSDNQNKDSLRVLVVDDKSANLEKAVDQLGKDHFLTLAGGYDEALYLIANNKYNYVLSDCQMPIGTKSSAIASSVISLGSTVHNGIFLMFPATESGAHFAIVTDANHHQDWVSAIIDNLNTRQIVNDRRVLFLNNIGKSWDKALDMLKVRINEFSKYDSEM